MGTKRLIAFFASLAVLAATIWEIPIVAKAIKWLFGLAASVDFIYERYKDPSWLGQVTYLALNPPPGTALLVALIGLVLIYWTTKPRDVRMSGPVLGMLAGVLLLAGCAVWYLVVHQSSTVDPSKSDAVERIAKLEKERDAFSSELAEAKRELESVRRTLATAPQEKPTTASPPTQPTADKEFASLSTVEKRNMVLALHGEVRPLLSEIIIVRSTVAPYSQDLGLLASLFEGAGIKASTGTRSPENPTQTGLMIGVRDIVNPHPAAKKIKELFASYGISTTYIKIAEGESDSVHGGF